MGAGVFDLKIRNNVRPTALMVEFSADEGSDAVNRAYVDLSITNAVAAKSITLTGDVIGSGTSSFATTLSNTGVVAGSYSRVTVDAKGRISAGGNITLSGDATGTESSGNIALTLASTGVVAGTYSKVTVDIKGRVTSAQNIANTDVTTALGYTPVNRAGDTMTGNLRLNTNPSHPLDAASKQYIDSKIWLAIAVGY